MDSRPRTSLPRTGLWLTLVLVLAFAAKGPTLMNGFTFDDAHYVRARTPDGTPNPMVAELHPVGHYFSVPLQWGVSYTCRGYRPVTVLSFALVHHLFGSENSDPAWPHHLCNVLLHVLATFLVFQLVRLFARDGPALIAALVFAAHALHTEAVASIVGRAELLAFTCGAAATWALVAALRSPASRGRWLQLGAAGLLSFVAFSSKESGVAWAGFAPLCAWLALRQRHPDAPVWQHLRSLTVAWTVACALPLLAFLALRHGVMVEYVDPRGAFRVSHEANPLFALSLPERIPSAVMLLGYGLYKCLLPISLSSSYRAHALEMAGWTDFRFVAAAAILLALAVVAFRIRHQRPLLWLAVAGFAVLSFVTSNLPFPVETVFAERFYYAPSLGIACAAAALAGMANQRRHLTRALSAVLVLWVGTFTWKSFERSVQWYDNDTLFTADAATNPRCVELQLNLAACQFSRFDLEGGEATLRRAAEIAPELPRPLVRLAQFVLGQGMRWSMAGRPEEAEPHLVEAEALLERALASRHLVPELEGRNIHELRAALKKARGDEEGSLRELETALELDPRCVHVRVELMARASERGDEAARERLRREGRALWPDEPEFAPATAGPQ